MIDTTAQPASGDTPMWGELPLPVGVRSRFVPSVNGLTMHVLEAGNPRADRIVVLLHGFPELAFSWRHQISALAARDFYVVAPDLRGYGRTTGDEERGSDELFRYSMPSLVDDVVALAAALGRRRVDAVVGHDFGSSLAGWCGLIRPELFRSVVMMSAPFGGPPERSVSSDKPRRTFANAVADLPALGLEHYQWYYSTPRAAREMNNPAQGMHDFLRGYFHVKSADWAQNAPHELPGMDASSLVRLPPYYVLPLGVGMPDVVRREQPGPAEIASAVWLPDDELAVYAAEFGRTGFDGGLRWYRSATSASGVDALRLFGGRTLDVPSAFIAGTSDWGVHQVPGAFRAMQDRVCTRMVLCELVPGAGHWVQQEQSEAVVDLVLTFLDSARSSA